MIKVNIEQGSEAWFQYRCGRITGTRFKTLMSGQTTQGYKDLITEIAGELITGEVEETYSNDAMERGKELEPEARIMYENELFKVDQVGFCLPDEENEFSDWIGVSPDGLLYDGMVEIKCPLRKTHLNYIEAGKLPTEYWWQVQGQLFVTGLAWCDFVSYYPNMKMFVVRVFPDVTVFEEITERLRITIPLIKAKLEIYNNYR
jgi:putative phage-type endonuclease